jgi:hypothetical protein
MAITDSSITLIKNLDTVYPVDNPMVITVAMDNQYIVTGVKANLFLEFSQIDANEGMNLNLSWGSRSLFMVLKHEPDDSGAQMHSAKVGQSSADWLAVLCADLYANYYLTKISK